MRADAAALVWLLLKHSRDGNAATDVSVLIVRHLWPVVVTDAEHCKIRVLPYRVALSIPAGVEGLCSVDEAAMRLSNGKHIVLLNSVRNRKLGAVHPEAGCLGAPQPVSNDGRHQLHVTVGKILQLTMTLALQTPLHPEYGTLIGWRICVSWTSNRILWGKSGSDSSEERQVFSRVSLARK